MLWGRERGPTVIDDGAAEECHPGKYRMRPRGVIKGQLPFEMTRLAMLVEKLSEKLCADNKVIF